MDCSPLGFSVHGIFPAWILEWVAIFYSRGSPQFRDWTHISYISCIGRWILYHCATWEAPRDTGYIEKASSEPADDFSSWSWSLACSNHFLRSSVSHKAEKPGCMLAACIYSHFMGHRGVISSIFFLIPLRSQKTQNPCTLFLPELKSFNSVIPPLSKMNPAQTGNGVVKWL